MSKEFPIEKLESIADKPYQYFIYDTYDSYEHELDTDDDPELHLGGVVDVYISKKSSWHGGSTSDVTVEVEDGIVLTDDGSIMFKDDPSQRILYLGDIDTIHSVWNERFNAIQGEY